MTDPEYQLERQRIDVAEQETKRAKAQLMLNEGKIRAESEAREKIGSLEFDLQIEGLRTQREKLLLRRKQFLKDNPFQDADK